MVTRIDYSNPDSGVVVTTQDGRVFKAPYVCVTVPVGYLQRYMGSLFSPALPSDKQAAINSLVGEG